MVLQQTLLEDRLNLYESSTHPLAVAVSLLLSKRRTPPSAFRFRPRVIKHRAPKTAETPFPLVPKLIFLFHAFHMNEYKVLVEQYIFQRSNKRFVIKSCSDTSSGADPALLGLPAIINIP
jgi:hypothetical protein